MIIYIYNIYIILCSVPNSLSHMWIYIDGMR